MFKKRYWLMWVCVAILAAVGVMRFIAGNFCGGFTNFAFAAYTVVQIFLLDVSDFRFRYMNLWRNLAERSISIIEEQSKRMRQMQERIDALTSEQPASPIGAKLEEDGTM